MKKKYPLSVVLIVMMSSAAFADAPKLKSEQEYKDDSQKICYDKWNTRGEVDRRMFNHCMEGQIEGYRELVHLHQYADQDFYSNTSFPYCREKWTKRGISDTRMMVHCLKQEIEGIRDVMYYREKYGADQVNQIAGRALAQFKSWNMAAYRVKQHFD